ncbi:hypothetical protein QLL95_gp0521 [Cotonvirus japonicus]|uniref:Uncharacterized protein n=1 Tax=Cotonvirus japonicus TaxID=2811091 RepID=A0ABM7NTV3_9VIRU|nr:hypothetical protein QLL95_gp0521 [Cotonvirus japonicus]BCS83602.1 hypothetical protein [Cotonvirus japonicus]
MKRTSSIIKNPHTLKTSKFISSKNLRTTDSYTSQTISTNKYNAQNLDDKATKQTVALIKEEPFDVDRELKQKLKHLGEDVVEVIVTGTCIAVIIAAVKVSM